MAHRMLEVTIISAEDLKDVRYVGKMHTFAIVSMPPFVEYTTQVHKAGGVDPVWNETFTFALPESELQKRDTKMRVEIFSLTSTTGQRYVGEALIPLSEIVRADEQAGRSMEKLYRSYAVKTSDGSLQGKVYLAFQLGETMMLDASSKPGDGVHHPVYPVWIAPRYPSASSAIHYPAPPESETLRPFSAGTSPARSSQPLHPEPPPPYSTEPPPYPRTYPVDPAPPPPPPYLPPPKPQYPSRLPSPTGIPEPQYPSRLPPTIPEPTISPYYPQYPARPLPGGQELSPDSVFAGPVGRVLLTELISESPYDRGYRAY